MQQPQWTKACLLSTFRGHTQTPHRQYDSSRRVTSSLQRPLPDNTQHLQQTDTYARGGNRTHKPSKRAATEPRLRPRGHCDRQSNGVSVVKVLNIRRMKYEVLRGGNEKRISCKIWMESLKGRDYLVGGVDGRVMLIRILEIYDVKLLSGLHR